MLLLLVKTRIIKISQMKLYPGYPNGEARFVHRFRFPGVDSILLV